MTNQMKSEMREIMRRPTVIVFTVEKIRPGTETHLPLVLVVSVNILKI